MKIDELKKLKDEGTETLPSAERRNFLRFGLSVTGVFLGGSVLSLTSVRNAQSNPAVAGEYPYKPHYSMVIVQNRCVDCERCLEACKQTNHVPSYGYRTRIYEQMRKIGPSEQERIFMPALCNQCNRPPCVRVCPTSATYKDKKHGIVMMRNERCIGCKTCMVACPYNARYYNEEKRAVDKCNFCIDTRLARGESLTACAAACPANVRHFGDLSDSKSTVYRLVHRPEKMVWVLRPETGAAPNVFYTND